MVTQFTGLLWESMSTTTCIHVNDQLLLVAGFAPPKGGTNPYMSPVDSAIGSGVTSGVTTKAPSVVADGDLEKFDDEEITPPGYSYQGYAPEPQAQGMPMYGEASLS